MLNVIKRL